MDLPRRLGQLHVIGDRVLIAPEDGEERTRVGLYPPATAAESQQVQSAILVLLRDEGPGLP